MSKKSNLHILVDTKNLALYSGGISGFFRPLLTAWVKQREDFSFTLCSPPLVNYEAIVSTNCSQHVINWPNKLPRQLRHPFYDNLLFPLAVKKVQPDFIFSPYHDVRIPKDIPSVMMIHDTCFRDLKDLYPSKIRIYYEHMLATNLRNTSHVLTVSDASKESIIRKYRLKTEQITVIPNSFAPFLDEKTPSTKELVSVLKAKEGESLKIFYPGGSDFRKNIERLLEAMLILTEREVKTKLWIAGDLDCRWKRVFQGMPEEIRKVIEFKGRLSDSELVSHYLACDVVIYPSLCEGFGRVVLESLQLGVPLACSNLPVLHEVAGNYPIYFDPRNSTEMAEAILRASLKTDWIPRQDNRFELARVQSQFIETLDVLIQEKCGRALR